MYENYSNNSETATSLVEQRVSFAVKYQNTATTFFCFHFVIDRNESLLELTNTTFGQTEHISVKEEKEIKFSTTHSHVCAQRNVGRDRLHQHHQTNIFL